ncbi:hypothetical protein ABMA28_006301, partial [Loxostege sticticalis]
MAEWRRRSPEGRGAWRLGRRLRSPLHLHRAAGRALSPPPSPATTTPTTASRAIKTAARTLTQSLPARTLT